MSDSKVYMVPDGNNSLDPNLMMALTQNGGFGNNGGLICHISETLDITDEEELANLNGNLNMRAYKLVESRL